MSNKHLIITGLMGSGKTTVGKLVANSLNREFIDTDQFLDKTYGSTQRILTGPNGDETFKAIEEEIAHTLSDRKKLVISTGGRFFLNPNNVAILSKSSIILCLSASCEELVRRLSNTTENTYRPKFIAAKDKLQLMNELNSISESHFKYFEKIPTTGKTAVEVAKEIALRFH